MLLSGAERAFIADGVDADLRADGRGRLDLRALQLETGVISQASGSARVVVGSTDVLVGIKADLGEPDRSAPAVGRLLCSVDCAPSASQEFEGRGAEELNTELTLLMGKVLLQLAASELASLCLLEGTSCWVLSIDAMVLALGGNVADVLSLAMRAALQDLRLPNVTVKHAETGKPELEVSDDPDDVRRLNVVSLPVLVTLHKIGTGHFVVDATREEEACTSAALHVAVNKKGHVCLLQKARAGMLHTSHINAMILAAQKIAKAQIAMMDALLQEQEGAPKRGFLGM